MIVCGRRPIFIHIAFLCALALWAAVPSGCSPKGKSDRPNLLLIDIDTLRPDHLGCYGYERDTSPTIDRFAKSGVLFETAYCQMPTTGPSHASLFTSKYPRSHGVLKNGWKLSDEHPTLAEVLKGSGFTTAAFVSSFPLDSQFGLARGFDSYDDKFSLEDSTMPVTDEWKEFELKGGFDQRAATTSDKAIKWLQEHSDKQFFLWVHYFDPHSPYVPPDEFAAKFTRNATSPLEQEIAKYDAEVLYVDAQVERLLDALSRQRLNSSTLVVIMSDHGEGLGQHGYMYHGMFLYDEQTRIALMMRFPGVLPKGLRVDLPVQSVDVFPTVLDLLKVKYDGDLSGQSLANMMREPGKATEHPVFLERRHFDPASKFGKMVPKSQFGIRRGHLKYIWAPEEGDEELYDLGRDPDELVDVTILHPDAVQEDRKLIEEWRRGESKEHHQQRVDEETRKKLEALGYIQ